MNSGSGNRPLAYATDKPTDRQANRHERLEHPLSTPTDVVGVGNENLYSPFCPVTTEGYKSRFTEAGKEGKRGEKPEKGEGAVGTRSPNFD